MQYRPLGKSEMKVSALALGAWQIGDPAYWGPDASADAQAAVDAAIDQGITLFDTAEGYGDGRSEEVLGRCLGTRREDVIIASKVGPDNCAPDRVRASCEASLRRLGTDFIDLYQVHWPNWDIPFEATWAALDGLREEGKVRAIGVSNFGAHDLDDWMGAGDAVSNQLGYNLLFRAIEFEILPACQRHGVGVLAYMPLMQGILAGRWETVDDIPVKRRRTRHFSADREGATHGETGHEALTMDTLASLRAIAAEAGLNMADLATAWLMAQPGVSSVIVGGRKPGQIERNCAAADLELDQELLERVTRATDTLKSALGPNPDMWKAGDDVRIR